MRAQLFSTEVLIVIAILLALVILFIYFSSEFGPAAEAREMERKELYRRGEEILEKILTYCFKQKSTKDLLRFLFY
ncbi:MAG: hypothetical protein QW507_03530 [Candidatus Nanoarchaeia archaeon]|nr:hypothetical protein [Candidatus Haiyanarchaeum thermophilum]MCW1303462.1 hypothetical protein [Candidatus Haiyanarchaeum thermophilum]MCW1306913.1 hypothetical protein [Candidatus Haiyanarchaeum thermophilum]MCW1307531.1 hypothetical protein [Candidatus Haiyanarchaeum thermophilum]MCW1308145.1 hypothetical protein [Candidatus Haiyanarchaeum thermophilum]